jgi:hypothetical protein
MTNDLYDPTKFIQALKVGNNELLKDIYSKWLEKLFVSELWDDSNQDGKRIPWKIAENAFEAMTDTFNSPGIYIFVTEDKKPLYLGRAKDALKKRLRRRYFGPKTKDKKYSQFQIAANNEQVLKSKGYDYLPKDILDWYHEQHNGNVRLSHAQKLAEYGIDGIWFSVLSFKDKKDPRVTETVEKLEKELIPIAEEWNSKKGYFKLLNKQNIK